MSGGGFFQHLPQSHSGEAECMKIRRKSIGKEARPAFKHRVKHLLQSHSGEAERMKIHRESTGKLMRSAFVKHLLQRHSGETECMRIHWKMDALCCVVLCCVVSR